MAETATAGIPEKIKADTGCDETRYAVGYLHHTEEGDVVYTLQKAGYKGSAKALIEGLVDNTLLFHTREFAENNADTYRKASLEHLENILMIQKTLGEQLGQNALEVVGKGLQVMPVEKKLKFI